MVDSKKDLEQFLNTIFAKAIVLFELSLRYFDVLCSRGNVDYVL